jgi:hypothetical protein
MLEIYRKYLPSVPTLSLIILGIEFRYRLSLVYRDQKTIDDFGLLKFEVPRNRIRLSLCEGELDCSLHKTHFQEDFTVQSPSLAYSRILLNWKMINGHRKITDP